jgi:hypothetical protein
MHRNLYFISLFLFLSIGLISLLLLLLPPLLLLPARSFGKLGGLSQFATSRSSYLPPLHACFYYPPCSTIDYLFMSAQMGPWAFQKCSRPRAEVLSGSVCFLQSATKMNGLSLLSSLSLSLSFSQAPPSSRQPVWQVSEMK